MVSKPVQHRHRVRLLGIAILAVAVCGWTALVAEPPAEPSPERVRRLIDEVRYREAEEQARQLLAAVDAEHGPDSAESAAALDLLIDSIGLGGRSSVVGARRLVERSLALKQRLYGSRHPATAKTLHQLGMVELYEGNPAEAREVVERALKMREELLGAKHLDVAESLDGLGFVVNSLWAPDEALPYYRRAIKIRKKELGGEHPLVAKTMHRLGWVLFREERYVEAENTARRALALHEKIGSPGQPQVGNSWSVLALLLERDGKYDEAEALKRERAEFVKRWFGPEHWWYGDAIQDIGASLADSGRYNEALSEYRRALEIVERAKGAEHPSVATILNNIGVTLKNLGRYEEALEHEQRALKIREAVYGPDHPAVADSLWDMAFLFQAMNRYPEAIEHFEAAYRIREAHYGTEDRRVARVLGQLGRLHSSQGNYAAALTLVDRSIKLRAETVGVDHPDYAIGLRQMAGVLQDAGAYDKAKTYLEGALQVQLKAFGPEHPEVATTRHNLGNLLGILFEPAEARKQFERVLAIREDLFGIEHPAVASILYTLGSSLYSEGRLDEARQHFERVLAIRAEVLGPEHPALVSTLRWLSNVRREMGDAEQSRSYVQRALDLQQKILDAGNYDEATALATRASLLLSRGEYGQARSCLEQVLALRKKKFGADHLYVASTLDQLADLVARMGAYTEAVEHLRRSLAIKQQLFGPQHPRVGHAHANLAGLFWWLGDYPEALRHADVALGVTKQLFGVDHAAVADSLFRLATILQEMGDYGEATRLAERVVEIREKVFGQDHRWTVQALDYLGWNLIAAGDAARARPLLERVVATLERQGAHGVGLVSALDSLTMALHELGEHDAAVRHAQRAVAIARENPTVIRGSLAWWLTNLGKALAGAGRDEEAEQAFTEALEILESHFGPRHPWVATTYHSLASLAWKRGAAGRAFELASRASSILDRHARETLAMLPERQALRLIASRARPEEILFSTLLHADAERRRPAIEACWEWSLRRRGLVLEELAERHRGGLEAGAVADAHAEWVAAKNRLAALTVRGPQSVIESVSALHVSASSDTEDEGSSPRRSTEEYLAALERAERDRDAADARLAELSTRFREARRVAAADLEDVTFALPRGGALVEYVRIAVHPPGSTSPELRDVALILPASGGRPTFADLGPAGRIDEAVRDWRRSLHDGLRGTNPALEAIRDSGTRLRELVWDPVKQQLGDPSTTFVVPDGPLHQVHFAALPAEEGGYLVESNPALHVLSTSRDLVRLTESRRSRFGSGVLALGSPDYDAGAAVRVARAASTGESSAFRGERSDCPLLGETQWNALPESGSEAQEIAALFEQRQETATVLIGADASEERVKREVSGKRVVHLATHGFFLQSGCASALGIGRGIGIVTATDSTAAKRTKADRPHDRSGENPLLLSGLALAGANQAAASGPDGEDGILTAEELAALDLQGVEIAALSACDTGLGTVAVGEGVFGLRRALEIAGARTVLMSLWPVPDLETRQWMSAFYSARLAGAPVLEAGRTASREALDRLREEGKPEHPYFWAGFQAAGDWR